MCTWKKVSREEWDSNVPEGNAHPRIYSDSHYTRLKEEALKPTPPLPFCPPPAQTAVEAAYWAKVPLSTNNLSGPCYHKPPNTSKVQPVYGHSCSGPREPAHLAMWNKALKIFLCSTVLEYQNDEITLPGRATVISVTPNARYRLWLISLSINNNFSLQKNLTSTFTASACGTLWGSNESMRTKHVRTLILSQLTAGRCC